MRTTAVAEAMGAMPRPVAATAPLAEVLDRLTRGADTTLPVLDEEGALRGVIGRPDVAEFATHDDRETTAGELARAVPTVQASDSLEQAVRALARTDDDGLPVRGPDGRVAGWITHRGLLAAYDRRRRMLSGDGPPEPAAAVRG
jgi:CIC family chloride channel protein